MSCLALFIREGDILILKGQISTVLTFMVLHIHQVIAQFFHLFLQSIYEYGCASALNVTASVPHTQVTFCSQNLYFSCNTGLSSFMKFNIVWHADPLLGNGSVNTFLKHMLSTIEGYLLLDNSAVNRLHQQCRLFSMGSMPSGYKRVKFWSWQL
jgi:hypothetical protein